MRKITHILVNLSENGGNLLKNELRSRHERTILYMLILMDLKPKNFWY